MRIILGSQSPRRKAILNECGFVVEVLPSHFDEESIRDQDPTELTRKLALAKSMQLRSVVSGDPCIVTADTVVFFEGRIYEKGSSPEQCASWIRSFQGKTISIYTTQVLYDVATAYESIKTSIAEVHFAQIPEDDVEILASHAYTASVAGAFYYDDPLLLKYITTTGDPQVVRGLNGAHIKKEIVRVEKVRLRERLKAEYKRHDLTAYCTEAVSELSREKLFLEFTHVLAYTPIRSLEIDCFEELKRLFPEKEWFVPVISGSEIEFPPASLEKACVIVPALAMSRDGTRLGKGKGFYDRFLQKHQQLKQRTITIIPDFALLPELPLEKHDEPIARVLVIKPTPRV